MKHDEIYYTYKEDGRWLFGPGLLDTLGHIDTHILSTVMPACLTRFFFERRKKEEKRSWKSLWFFCVTKSSELYVLIVGEDSVQPTKKKKVILSYNAKVL